MTIDDRQNVQAGSARRDKAERKRILCVDDERHVVDALALQLHRRFEVVAVTDPREALAIATGSSPPHAIVSDNRMPGMSGIELLSEVKRKDPFVARILLTGYSEFSAAVEAVNSANVHRFLVKPCPPQELVKALDESLAAVAESTRADAAELEKLSRLATLGSMAGHIGHEIGNLVAALEGTIESVRAHVADGTPTVDDVELLGDVRSRLSEHAVHLKHLARPKSVKLETVDARQLVRRAVTLVDSTGAIKVARRTVVVGDTPLPLVVDRFAVEGVLINLVKNAGEALAERALKEDPRAGWRPELGVTVAQDGNVAVVTVEDNGPGIAPETMQRLFEAFFTTKGESKGTGLGLTIARKTIERSGGSIHVESELGRYTRFIVTLPLAPAATP